MPALDHATAALNYCGADRCWASQQIQDFFNAALKSCTVKTVVSFIKMGYFHFYGSRDRSFAVHLYNPVGNAHTVLILPQPIIGEAAVHLR